jgi:hypothetical protein
MILQIGIKNRATDDKRFVFGVKANALFDVMNI